LGESRKPSGKIAVRYGTIGSTARFGFVHFDARNR
jgi:hypothetical protein